VTDMRLKGGYLCPRCDRDFRSDACPHDWGDVASYNLDRRIREIVREEVKRLCGVNLPVDARPHRPHCR
jgi:hypothetical protein